MAPIPLPDQALLLKLLRYEPDTGKLFWRERTPEMMPPHKRFTPESSAKNWNSRFAHKEALAYIADTGYKCGVIFGVSYLAHRVIWKMQTGEDPIEVDHDDGNRANNRFNNLKSLTHQQNALNKQRNITNTSGRVGVRRVRSGKWLASIKLNGKMIYLGKHETFDQASSARELAEVKYGFNRNHGRPPTQHKHRVKGKL